MVESISLTRYKLLFLNWQIVDQQFAIYCYLGLVVLWYVRWHWFSISCTNLVVITSGGTARKSKNSKMAGMFRYTACIFLLKAFRTNTWDLSEVWQNILWIWIRWSDWLNVFQTVAWTDVWMLVLRCTLPGSIEIKMKFKQKDSEDTTFRFSFICVFCFIRPCASLLHNVSLSYWNLFDLWLWCFSKPWVAMLTELPFGLNCASPPMMPFSKWDTGDFPSVSLLRLSQCRITPGDKLRKRDWGLKSRFRKFFTKSYWRLHNNRWQKGAHQPIVDKLLR